MVRFPTATPDTPAEVIVRDAAELTCGDRVLHFRGGARWAEIVTVLEVAADGAYVNVQFLFDNDALTGTFSAVGHAPFVVLTAGVCGNPHSGMALMCTPAPYRLDDKPWPGYSLVCDSHRRQMASVQARPSAPRTS